MILRERLPLQKQAVGRFQDSARAAKELPYLIDGKPSNSTDIIYEACKYGYKGIDGIIFSVTDAVLVLREYGCSVTINE